MNDIWGNFNFAAENEKASHLSLKLPAASKIFILDFQSNKFSSFESNT